MDIKDIESILKSEEFDLFCEYNMSMCEHSNYELEITSFIFEDDDIHMTTVLTDHTLMFEVNPIEEYGLNNVINFIDAYKEHMDLLYKNNLHIERTVLLGSNDWVYGLVPNEIDTFPFKAFIQPASEYWEICFSFSDNSFPIVSEDVITQVSFDSFENALDGFHSLQNDVLKFNKDRDSEKLFSDKKGYIDNFVTQVRNKQLGKRIQELEAQVKQLSENRETSSFEKGR